MLSTFFSAGLSAPAASPAAAGEIENAVTEEAGFEAHAGRRAPRLRLAVQEGESVAEGQAIAHLGDAPEVAITSPVSARIGRIALARGHRLSEIVLFHDPRGEVVTHDVADVRDAPSLRRLMLAAGLWPAIRRRPFGGSPAPAEVPAAIFVTGADTRPLAPDPRVAIDGRRDDLARGLAALGQISAGPVYLCQDGGSPILPAREGLVVLRSGPRHPQGLAGIRIHDAFPATLDRPVWDLHIEDAADLGTLLATGRLPFRRLVRIAGPALREERLVRTQPGADLRALIRRIVSPGAHLVLSGSPLDGVPAHWLAPRDRQVTVTDRDVSPPPAHWLVHALRRARTVAPIIPTAALEQAMGGRIPATAFLRALASGDDETAMKMGILSLLEEDVALADYVLGRETGLSALLRGILERIETEFAA